MIIFVLLIYFINYILCCYTNITSIIETYVPTPIKITNSTSTSICSVSYISSLDYVGGCADIRINQGSRCKTSSFISSATICSQTNIEKIVTTTTPTPTTFNLVYNFKLDCKNKSSSSLITIFSLN